LVSQGFDSDSLANSTYFALFCLFRLIPHGFHQIVRLFDVVALAFNDCANRRGQVFRKRVVISLDSGIFTGFSRRQNGVIAAAQR